MTESTRRALAFLNAAPVRLHQLGHAEARAMFEQIAPALDMPAPQLAERRSLELDGVPAELSRPTAAGDGPLPLIVFFHGGGFVIGSVTSYRRLTGHLANLAGALVLSVDYRLAPEHPFPAAPEDALRAFRAAAARAAELGADPAQLFLAGDSAGGNLAAVTALLARDAGGPRAAGQILIYPVTDMAGETASRRAFASGLFLEQETMRWFGNAYLPDGIDPADWRASPLRAARHADLPAAFILTAQLDPLRDEGEAYGDKLRAAGVEVTGHRHAGMIHGFLSMGGLIPEARDALTLIAAWLRRKTAGRAAG